METKQKQEPIGWVKFWKPLDDWYALSTPEREYYYNHYQSLAQHVVDQGAQLIGTYKCRGQSDWERFEFWEFPKLEMLIEFTNGLEEINHYLYFAESATFGRRYDRFFDAQNWVV